MHTDGARWRKGRLKLRPCSSWLPTCLGIPDRTSDHRGNRENGEFVEILVRSNGQRIGDDHLGDAAVLQATVAGGSLTVGLPTMTPAAPAGTAPPTP
jgi:hypothetical protein